MSKQPCTLPTWEDYDQQLATLEDVLAYANSGLLWYAV